MVAIIVAFGIIVLCTLIVLAATIIAGRADAHAEDYRPRPKGTSTPGSVPDHATTGAPAVEVCLASSDRDET